MRVIIPLLHRRWQFILSGVLLLLVAGCGKSEQAATSNQSAAASGSSQASAADSAAAGGTKGNAGQVGQPSPGQGQQPGDHPAEPAIPVAVQTAFVGNIASYYSATASLEAEKQAGILARVSGLVQSIACEEGDHVSEGQELLRIANDEYLLRVKQAAATTANLRERYERLQAMLDEQLVTEEEFQTAKSDLAAAEAEEGLAQLNLSYTTVTAPFSGKVVQRLVDVGQNVSAGTSLFVVADFDPLLAKVHVPSREFKKLQPNQPVRLLLDSSQLRLQGSIKLISPIIDPTSGTIKVTVEVPKYPPQTRPGDFADVRIVTERRTGATLVPKIAVLSDKGEDVVFVAADNVAERRVVTVGFTDDDNTEIIDGIEPGEPVVIKGQRSLKHGDRLKIIEGPGEMLAGPDAEPSASPAAAAQSVSPPQGDARADSTAGTSASGQGT